MVAPRTIFTMLAWLETGRPSDEDFDDVLTQLDHMSQRHVYHYTVVDTVKGYVENLRRQYNEQNN